MPTQRASAGSALPSALATDDDEIAVPPDAFGVCKARFIEQDDVLAHAEAVAKEIAIDQAAALLQRCMDHAQEIAQASAEDLVRALLADNAAESGRGDGECVGCTGKG